MVRDHHLQIAADHEVDQVVGRVVDHDPDHEVAIEEVAAGVEVADDDQEVALRYQSFKLLGFPQRRL